MRAAGGAAEPGRAQAHRPRLLDYYWITQTEMMALSYLYTLCMWIHLMGPSLGTGFVYRFPSITMQRQRLKSEQSGTTGPPTTGSRTHLRTVIRPSFKTAYKQVTALEWRCCPGFVGDECREGVSLYEHMHSLTPFAAQSEFCSPSVSLIMALTAKRMNGNPSGERPAGRLVKRVALLQRAALLLQATGCRLWANKDPKGQATTGEIRNAETKHGLTTPTLDGTQTGHGRPPQCMNCTGFNDMTGRINAIESKIKLLEEGRLPLPMVRLPEGSTENEVDRPQPTPMGPPSYLPSGAKTCLWYEEQRC
ncbi:unnamed protein product [Menidia menidia]|uniref:(Atlantic silverside) hypothetical protein n=1 Tax=Menidia menidia TaxID=238744 RepID=A0A8S4BK07_9TELE|nr:unnamed protein product [Menidia menidia]